MRIASLIKKGVMICSVVLAFHGSDAHADGVALSQSPDGFFQLRRLPADPGERGEARKILEIIDPGGKTLFQWISPLGVSSAIWSQDSRFLAVNDGPGRGGDQVWIFSLDRNAKRVMPLREPDGKKLKEEMACRHGSFLHFVEAVSFRGLEWRDNRLWCSVNGTHSPKRNRSVHIPFHYLWVLEMSGSSTPLVEEWTRTDPKEKPFRDPLE